MVASPNLFSPPRYQVAVTSFYKHLTSCATTENSLEGAKFVAAKTLSKYERFAKCATTDLCFTVSVTITCMPVSWHRVGVDDPTATPVACRLVTLLSCVNLANQHADADHTAARPAVLHIPHKFTRQNVCIRNCKFGQQSLYIELFDLSCFSSFICARMPNQLWSVMTHKRA